MQCLLTGRACRNTRRHWHYPDSLRRISVSLLQRRLRWLSFMIVLWPFLLLRWPSFHLSQHLRWWELGCCQIHGLAMGTILTARFAVVSVADISPIPGVSCPRIASLIWLVLCTRRRTRFAFVWSVPTEPFFRVAYLLVGLPSNQEERPRSEKLQNHWWNSGAVRERHSADGKRFAWGLFVGFPLSKDPILCSRLRMRI